MNTRAPLRWRSAPMRCSILFVILCLILLFSSHPTAGQIARRTRPPPTSTDTPTLHQPSTPTLDTPTTPTADPSTDPPIDDPLRTHTTVAPTEVPGTRTNSRPLTRTIRRDSKSSREEKDPGMIPWTPQLPTHTGGKPWRYKTGDGQIREGGQVVGGKDKEGQQVESDAEEQSGSKAAGSGEDDELEPQSRLPKPNRRANGSSTSRRSSVRADPTASDVDAAADGDKPQSTPRDASRRSKHGRRDDTEADEDAVGGTRPASRDVGVETETETETDSEAGEGDELDFDTALERKKKSALTRKGSKEANKRASHNSGKQSSRDKQREDADDAVVPNTRKHSSAPAADADDSAPAADRSAPTDSEEELSVAAGVVPPTQPEPRRTRRQPVISSGKGSKRGSESAGVAEESVATVTAASSTNTTQTQAEPLSEVAANLNADATEPVDSNDAAGVPAVKDSRRGRTSTPSTPTAVLTGTQVDNITDSLVPASGDDTLGTKTTAGEVDTVLTEGTADSTTTTAGQPAAADDESLVSPLADTLVAPNTSSATAVNDTTVASFNDLVLDADPELADSSKIEPPPPVKPTVRRTEPKTDEEKERDSAQRAAEAALEASQSTTDPTSTDPATRTVDTPATTPLSPDDTPVAAGDVTPADENGVGALADTLPADTPIVPSVPAVKTDIPTVVTDGVILTDSNNADLPIDTSPEATTPAATTKGEIGADTSSKAEADSDSDAEAASAAAAEVDSAAWKRSSSTSTTSFLRRSLTAGIVLCVVVGCVILIGKKVKETLDSHEDEGSDPLLSKMETGQGATSILSNGVLASIAGSGGSKKDEDDGRVRVKPAVVEEENEEDRYQQQQNKMRAMTQAAPRGMSLTKAPLPPPASKKPTLAVLPVDDEEDTELEGDEEEQAEAEEEVVEEGAVEVQEGGRGGSGVADAVGGGGDGDVRGRERKTSDDGGWESFENDWED